MEANDDVLGASKNEHSLHVTARPDFVGVFSIEESEPEAVYDHHCCKEYERSASDAVTAEYDREVKERRKGEDA